MVMKAEWKPYIRLGVCAFVLFLAVKYWDALVLGAGMLLQAAGPLVVGAVVAYIVNILMSCYERWLGKIKRPRWLKLRLKKPLWPKLQRPVCILLAILTVVAVVAVLLRLIIPQLISCFEVLIAALPKAIGSAYAWLDETFGISQYVEDPAQLFPATTDWRSILTKGAELLLSGVGGVMNVAFSALSAVTSSMISFFLGLVFAFYILTGKETLGAQMRRLCKKTLGERLTHRAGHVLKVLDTSFHAYIVGQCLEALILGAMCAVGMLILRLPYAIMIGALVGMTALIPVAGAYIGAAVGAVMIFSVSPMQALIFLVFLVVLQQIEGNLIYPRTVGSSLGLPGIWVLSAVTIGGGVMGVVGMLIFVPVAAAAYQLVREYVNGKK